MTDRFTVRAVVIGLAVIALTGIVGMILLALDDRPIPDALVAVCSLAAGALAGVLARTSTEPPV